MMGNFSSKLILGLAVAAGLLWTLVLAAAFGLVAFTDDVTLWLNDVLQVDPQWAQWLASAGTWLADFGGWVILVIWVLGVVALAMIAGFARKIARHFSQNAANPGV
jgi:uncharacterized protein involved in cysteine biosynthesis